MNSSLVLKLCFILPLLLFVDYILMALIGFCASSCGAGDSFFCGIYCSFGKILLILSVLFFGYLLYPDINQLLKKNRNAKTKKD